MIRTMADIAEKLQDIRTLESHVDELSRNNGLNAKILIEIREELEHANALQRRSQEQETKWEIQS